MSTNKIVWGDLIRLEPGLETLESQIREHAAQHRKDGDYCANENWHNNFKRVFVRLAGVLSPVAGLRTIGAYEVAYDHLYGLLPNCRHHGLCGG